MIGIHFKLFRNTYGFIGVDLFFALSGFLITCLLIEEWKRSKKISLSSFYARRALRLLPALAGMLAVFIAYGAIFDNHREFLLDLKEAAIALFYCSNWTLAFDLSRIDFMRHTWSLSIEEQFYLIWPGVLLFMVRRTSPASILNFIVLGAVLSWVTRVLLNDSTAASLGRLSNGLDTRADTLLLGCAVAVALAFGLVPQSRAAVAALRYAAALSVLGLAAIGFTLSADLPFMVLLGWSLISIFSAAIILQVTTTSGTMLHRFLENPILVFIGKISYGLYLWHYPIMRGMMSLRKTWRVNVPLAICITVVATLASYYLLELPCLRLKKRFQKTNTEGN